MTPFVCLVSVFTLLIALFYHSKNFMQLNAESSDYALLAEPLNFFATVSPHLHFFIYFLTITFIFFGLLHFRSLFFRVVSFVMFFLCMSIMMSNGKISHDCHGTMFLGLFCCFYQVDKPLLSKRNFVILRLTQGTLLFHYFLSGTWKVRSFFGAHDLSFEAFALKQATTSFAQGKMSDIASVLILENLFLFKVGFLMVICFQLSCVYPILKQKYYRHFGVVALFFHLATEITIGIRFNMTRVAILAALILFEEFLRYEKSNAVKLGSVGN